MRRLVLAAILVTSTLAGPGARAQEGPVDLLSQYDIRVDGAEGDEAGSAVDGGGDVNGDGTPDMIVGMVDASDGPNTYSGGAAVIFGDPTPRTMDLSESLGSSGFFIDGAAAGDNAGTAVAMLGDINDDDLADVAVGAWDASNNGRVSSGSVYVVFGKATTTTVELSALGTQGYRIDGAEQGHLLGSTISNARDVNNDGIFDLIVGVPYFGPDFEGAAYVVFGKTSNTTVDLASLGASGFRIDGASEDDGLGEDVAGVGDINDDGKADVVVGAPAEGSNGAGSGAAYVVFGKSTTTAVDLASLGTGGYAIYGTDFYDNVGSAVGGVGDMNDDGVREVIVGAPGADPSGRSGSGSTYVVFGKGDDDPIELDSLGSGGFRIDGPGDTAGVTGTGRGVDGGNDVNGDGIPDVIVSAWGNNSNNRVDAGSVFVVFGRDATTTVDLQDPDPDEAFSIDGAAVGDDLGISAASAGDVNDDGFTDVVMGARHSDANGPDSGSAYIELVADWLPGDCANPRSGTDDGDTLIGGAEGDDITGGDGADTLEGAEGDDCINGGDGKDEISGSGGQDSLKGGLKADEILGGDGADELFGKDGGDTLEGQSGSDELDGGGGGDTLEGESSGDTMEGLEGEDTIKGGDGGDTQEGGDGGDTVKGGKGEDTLKGQGGSDTLKGEDGEDTLKGGDGSDVLTGGEGKDVIEAGDGADEINADDGKKDTIDCGSGNDDVDHDSKDILIDC